MIINFDMIKNRNSDHWQSQDWDDQAIPEGTRHDRKLI